MKPATTTIHPYEKKIKALTQFVSAVNFAGGRSGDPDVQAELSLVYGFIRDRIEAIKKENKVSSFT